MERGRGLVSRSSRSTVARYYIPSSPRTAECGLILSLSRKKSYLRGRVLSQSYCSHNRHTAPPFLPACLVFSEKVGWWGTGVGASPPLSPCTVFLSVLYCFTPHNEAGAPSAFPTSRSHLRLLYFTSRPFPFYRREEQAEAPCCCARATFFPRFVFDVCSSLLVG